MKTILVQTKKITSHLENGEPIYETINQHLAPEMTFNKFLKYLPNQNYAKVTVLEVSEDDKKLNEVELYQGKVDKALKPEVKTNDKDAIIAELTKRLEALESAQKEEAPKRGRKSQDQE